MKMNLPHSIAFIASIIYNYGEYFPFHHDRSGLDLGLPLNLWP